MEMKKPTKVQVKEFWKGYGIKPQFGVYPKINLNNLFRHIVPKAVRILPRKEKFDEEQAHLELFSRWLKIGYDAQALFWALDVLQRTRWHMRKRDYERRGG